MVERNLTIPHDFLCITDDPTGVECKTLPVEEDLPGWWSKLTLFRKRSYGLKRILFLDLDVVITDNIDCFDVKDQEFVIIKDWNYESYNSSAFLLEIGSRRKVWDKFIKNKDRIMKTHHGDQDWITKHAEGVCWPVHWCVSFKENQLPVGKISIFHGKPDPHEVGGWVAKAWV